MYYFTLDIIYNFIIKEILLGTKDGSITLYKCEWSQKGGNEIIEDSFKPLVVLPGNKFIENIEV